MTAHRARRGQGDASAPATARLLDLAALAIADLPSGPRVSALDRSRSSATEQGRETVVFRAH